MHSVMNGVPMVLAGQLPGKGEELERGKWVDKTTRLRDRFVGISSKS